MEGKWSRIVDNSGTMHSGKVLIRLIRQSQGLLRWLLQNVNMT